jgi:starch-binding outer membrane protein, SusD/RagB family
MKNIIYKLSIALLVLAVSGCEDFLDRKPIGRYTQDNYPGGGLNEYVYGMYSDLRLYGAHAWPFVGVTSIRSDDADKGSTVTDGADAQGAYDNFTLLPGHSLTATYYKDSYAVINKSNVVLFISDSIKTTITETEYNLAQAEAKFIRGYMYFNLVRGFGGVPKVDKIANANSNFNTPRSTAAEIYTFIEDDLLEAIQYLPLSWPPEFKGRPTKGSAQGILAKVYLYQERWGESLALCETIMGSGEYDLNSTYGSIFAETGENNSESIFEVQCILNQSYNFGCEYALGQGIRGSGTMNLGWGFNSPSQQLVNAYEAGDPRKEATILFEGESTIYGEVVPALPGVPNVRYNQKVYTNPTYRTAANSTFGEWMNVRILRYADVVLMAAEAANELDQNTDALEYLEMIRLRARNGNNAILPEITETDQDLLRELIWHERRIELAMEHERFFDLVRWGVAADVLHAAGKAGFVAGKHELLPIPQSEIDRSDGVLTQNFGY